MTNKDKGGQTSDLNVKIQNERQSEHLFKMGLEAMRLFTLLMNEILCFYKLPSTSQNQLTTDLCAPVGLASAKLVFQGLTDQNH